MNISEDFEGFRSSGGPDEKQKLFLEELEKLIFENQEVAPENKIRPMWRLAQTLKCLGMKELAEQKFRMLLELVSCLEGKAQIVLALGQMAEQAGDYFLAVSFYREALSMEPATSWTWYFIQNNLGYSLNQLGRYDEAEIYCRRAISTIPELPNAHKNLGLALIGLKRFSDAAISFVTATHAEPLDHRATGHLEELLDSHPELQIEFQHQLESCKNALQVAAFKGNSSGRKPSI